MPLTKQQLLIPRVLCIGGKEGETNYPGGPVKTGQILTLFSNWFYETEDQKSSVHKYAVKDFPHLFKPLPWWYGRTVEEMPEYVKNEYHVFNVEKWVIDKTAYLGFVYVHKGYKELSIDLTPADESEYQEYQKQKGA